LTHGGANVSYSRSNLAAILLAVLAATEAALYVQLHISNINLNSAYGNKKREFTELQGRYGELDAAYHSLNTSYESLGESYNVLQHQYDVLDLSYIDLLETQKMETSLRIGNSLESYFDYLRQEKVPPHWPSYQRKADFGANLALHGLGVNCWPSLENEYLQAAGRHSYESAKERIDYVTDIMEANAYDSPTEKIRKILDFISDHISYEEEIDEVFLAPAETLAFRSGDCDDFSILAACLLETMNVETAFGIFRNTDDKYHCMVLVHLDELEGYEYWGLSDLTKHGLAEGKWIVIEPQYPISRQDLEWIGQWNLVAAAPIGASK